MTKQKDSKSNQWKPFNNWKTVNVTLDYEGNKLNFKVFEEDADTSYREEKLESMIAIECYDEKFTGLFKHKQKYEGKHYGFMTFVGKGKLQKGGTLLIEGLGFGETEYTSTKEDKLIKQILEKAGVFKFSKELAKSK